MVSHGHAYLATKEFGLQIYSVETPASPSWRGEIASADQTWDVAVRGDHLFVVDYTGGLLIYSLAADPAAPDLVGAYTPGWNIAAVALNGDTLIVAGDRVALVDISDLSDPTELADHDLDRAGACAAWVPPRAFVGDADGHVIAYNDALESVGSWYDDDGAGLPWALGLTADGDHLFLADWGMGLIILDAGVGLPTEVGRIDLAGYTFYDTFVQGDRAYAATTYGLGVIDITDRSDPVLVDYISTTIELSDMQHGVWVEDDVAYIADNGEQKFIIVSVFED